MSELNAADVEHLATLARIELEPDEIKAVASDFTDIHSLILKVQEAAGPDVAVTSHPIVMPNAVRPDEVGEVLSTEQVLQSAPASASGRFRVTAILGEEQ